MYKCSKGHMCCCVRCMARAAKIAIADKTIVRCQERDRCDVELDEADLRALLARVNDPVEYPMSLADTYAQQILLRCVMSIPGIIACPTPGCSNWIIPFDISLFPFPHAQTTTATNKTAFTTRQFFASLHCVRGLPPRSKNSQGREVQVRRVQRDVLLAVPQAVPLPLPVLGGAQVPGAVD